MSKGNHLLNLISQSLFGKVTVKNVLESHVWLIGVVLFFLTVMSIFHVDTMILVVLFVILFMLVFYYIYSHHYFMKKAPEYLRSETYQLERQKLEMVGQKGKELPAESITGTESIESPKKITIGKSKRSE